MSAKVSLVLATLCLAGALLVGACGGGGGGAGGLPDVGKIPTATAFAVLPEPTILSGGVPVAAGGGGDTYVVKPGDTLMSIADDLGVAIDDLISLNDLADPSHLEVDQVLKVPPRSGAQPTAAPTKQSTRQGTPTRQPTRTAAGTGTYEVQSGDNAADIAARFGVTLQELADANHTTINDLRSLEVGQVLTIPQSSGGTPVPTSTSEAEAAATETPTEVPVEETPEDTATPVEETATVTP